MVDRAVAVGGVAGILSGIPLAPLVAWYVRVRYGIEMPLEVAAGASLFGAGDPMNLLKPPGPGGSKPPGT